MVAIRGKSQLASLDSESSIRVWDVRTFTCLQHIRPAEQPRTMAGVFSTMDLIRQILFDDDSGTIVTGSTKLACWDPVGGDMDEKNGGDFAPKRHKRHKHKHSYHHHRGDDNQPPPISCVLWNHNFRQVVTASHGGRIVVWDAETGRRVFWFTAYDGDGGSGDGRGEEDNGGQKILRREPMVSSLGCQVSASLPCHTRLRAPTRASG